MNEIIESYLNSIEMLFVYSPIVSEYFVRARDVREREGYIRIRARLSNGDILEGFEFIVAINSTISILTYRIQWQTADAQLKRRWDNAEHHRHIETFPHHVHVGVLEEVQPSEPMSIQRALEIIEGEIAGD